MLVMVVGTQGEEVIVILKNAGVDLNTPKPVTVTLQKFAAKLKELKALLRK